MNPQQMYGPQYYGPQGTYTSSTIRSPQPPPQAFNVGRSYVFDPSGPQAYTATTVTKLALLR